MWMPRPGIASRSRLTARCVSPASITRPTPGCITTFCVTRTPASAGYASLDPLGVLPALNRHTRVDNRLTRLDPLGLMCACMNKSSDADIKQEGGFRPQANYSKKTECTGKFFDKRPKTVYRVDTRQRQRLDLDDLPDSAWTEMPRNTPGAGPRVRRVRRARPKRDRLVRRPRLVR